MVFFRGLKSFLQVAQTHSFTLAGERLGTSAAAVSQNVKRLEAELGVQLVTRTTRSVKLTGAGEVLASRGAVALLELEDALGQARQLATLPAGRLRVTCTVGYGRNVIAPLAARFALQYPAIELELVFSDAIKDLIEEGFDVAIRGGKPEDSSFVARPLAEVRPTVLASPAYLKKAGIPLRPQDVLHHRCIGFAPQEGRKRFPWRFASGGNSFQLEPACFVTSSDGNVACDFAALGLGLIQVSSHIAAPYVAAKKLQPVLEKYVDRERQYYVYFSHSKRMEAKVRAWVDFVIGEIAPTGRALRNLPLLR